MNRRFIDLTGVPPAHRLPLVEGAMRQLRTPAELPHSFRVALGVHRVDMLALRDVAPPIGVTLTSIAHPDAMMTRNEQVDTTIRAARVQLTTRLKAYMNHLSGPVEVRLRVERIGR